MSHARIFPVITILCATVAATIQPCYAQTVEERAGARAAADRGFEAFKRNNWPEAIDLFNRAEAVVHSPVHLLYLARSHAQLGKLVEAKDIYLKLSREEIPADAPAAVMQAQQSGKQELTELEPRIPYVSIVVAGDAPPPDVQVYMDQKLVPRALVGVPFPVNPGTHTWQAVHGDHRSSENSLTLAEGAQETIILSLKMPKGEQAQPASTPNPPPTSGVSDTPESSAGMPLSKKLLIGSIVGYGVGLAGIGGGVYFLLDKQGHEEDIDARGGADTPENQKSLDEANTAGTLATVGFIAGGVGVAAGTTLLILSLREKKAEQTQMGFSVTPWIGYRSLGVSGTF